PGKSYILDSEYTFCCDYVRSTNSNPCNTKYKITLYPYIECIEKIFTHSLTKEINVVYPIVINNCDGLTTLCPGEIYKFNLPIKNLTFMDLSSDVGKYINIRYSVESDISKYIILYDIY